MSDPTTTDLDRLAADARARIGAASRLADLAVHDIEAFGKIAEQARAALAA